MSSVEEAIQLNRFADIRCHMVDTLIDCAVWGLLHWSVCQRIAKSQCVDNEALGMQSHPALLEMAQLGCGGMYSGNVRRDAFVKFRPNAAVVKPQMIKLPCLATRALDRMLPMEINVPIILPNLLFESFHKHFPVKFQACLGGGLRSFWDSVNPDDPRLVGNPMVEVDNWKDKFFPVTVHGDGARFNMRGNSLMVVSMSFLLLHGWSLDSIFVAVGVA